MYEVRKAGVSVANLSKYGGNADLRFRSTGYFRVEQTPKRWWFVGSGGVCVSHHRRGARGDDSDLKYPHNLSIWEDKYGGSKERWIREGLVRDLKSWGFNTIGRTQDYIGGGWRKAFDWGERVTADSRSSSIHTTLK